MARPSCENADRRALMDDALHHLCQHSKWRISRAFWAKITRLGMASRTSQALKAQPLHRCGAAITDSGLLVFVVLAAAELLVQLFTIVNA